eukprot:403331737
MDDFRGGRQIFMDNQSSAHGSNLDSSDPLECTQLVDEMHKLFQFIDEDSKGYLTVEEILTFQLNLARKEEIKLTKMDESQLINSFFMQINRKENQNQGGIGVQYQHAFVIDWQAFRNTMNEWITQMSHIGITIQDQNGNLTQRDRMCLHQVLMAFFLHNQKDKRMELLQRAHLQIENLERDLENLNINGNSAFSAATVQQQMEILQSSKFLSNNFQSILADIQTNQTSAVESAFQRLRGMLDVLIGFTQRFELMEISEHVRRVFDLILSSTLLETSSQILEYPDDLKISPIKLEVLKCIGLLSIGGKLFSQSEIQINTEDNDNDMQILQKLQSQLMNYDLIIKPEIYFMVLICSLQEKLYEILIREDQPSDELLICSILSIGRVLHLHPQGEIPTMIFDILCQIIQQTTQQSNVLLCQSALRCLYNTVRFTRQHTSTLCQMKLASYLQTLIDKNFDEKINLYCLQIIREMVLSGQHLYIMDNLLLGCLMRIIQLNDTPLYGIATDIIRALVEVTTQNALHLVNFGFLRVICNSLIEFKLYKDYAIQQCYEYHIQETGGYAFSLGKQSSPGRKSLSNFKIYSYGFLFKNIMILDLFLNFIGKRQQILASFTQELLDKFRPLVDLLYAQLQTLKINDPVKIQTTEYVLKFFQNLRNKTWQIGFDQDDSQVKYLEFIIQFLQQTLLPFEAESQGYSQIGSSRFQINDRISQPSFMMLIKTYDNDSYVQDNKIFEIPSNIKYKELQELINKKYNNQPIQMAYIDEDNEQITFDSDLVLNKALQLAIKNAYKEQSKETILRIIIHKLSSMYFQCFECGGQFSRDPRVEINAASGGSNICTSCWPAYSQGIQ